MEKGSHPPRLGIFYEENKSFQMPKEKKNTLKDGKCWKKPASGTYTFKYQSNRVGHMQSFSVFISEDHSSPWQVHKNGYFFVKKKLFFLLSFLITKACVSLCLPPWSPSYTQWGIHVIYTYIYNKVCARSTFPTILVPWCPDDAWLTLKNKRALNSLLSRILFFTS